MLKCGLGLIGKENVHEVFLADVPRTLATRKIKIKFLEDSTDFASRNAPQRSPLGPRPSQSKSSNLRTFPSAWKIFQSLLAIA
jgi:hypothetical protein